CATPAAQVCFMCFLRCATPGAQVCFMCFLRCATHGAQKARVALLVAAAAWHTVLPHSIHQPPPPEASQSLFPLPPRRGGRTVVLTIHQPSFRITALLHRMALLVGGQVAFHGATPALRAHLAALHHPVPPHVSPFEPPQRSAAPLGASKVCCTAWRCSSAAPSPSTAPLPPCAATLQLRTTSCESHTPCPAWCLLATHGSFPPSCKRVHSGGSPSAQDGAQPCSNTGAAPLVARHQVNLLEFALDPLPRITAAAAAAAAAAAHGKSEALTDAPPTAPSLGANLKHQLGKLVAGGKQCLGVAGEGQGSGSSEAGSSGAEGYRGGRAGEGRVGEGRAVGEWEYATSAV
ncbi:unnamed protein product, partial [Closterium sp. Naga37s-1]